LEDGDEEEAEEEEEDVVVVDDDDDCKAEAVVTGVADDADDADDVDAITGDGLGGCEDVGAVDVANNEDMEPEEEVDIDEVLDPSNDVDSDNVVVIVVVVVVFCECKVRWCGEDGGLMCPFSRAMDDASKTETLTEFISLTACGQTEEAVFLH
jgi:hypothetical protein